MTVSSRPRQQRALDTRLRLLDGAFASLVENGYSGTTTQAVCRRTGASRGTLLHHFPSRTELVVAALEHVLTGRVEDFRQAALKRDTPPQLTDLVEMLWENLQGPAFFAWLELTVAARTNPELLAPLKELMVRFDEALLVASQELMPSGTVDDRFGEIAHRFAFAVLNGLAVDLIFRSKEDLRPMVDVLSLLANHIDLLQPGASETPND